MTASSMTVNQVEHRSAIRRLIVRHPIATFLCLVFSISTVVPVVPPLTRPGVLPFGLAP